VIRKERTERVTTVRDTVRRDEVEIERSDEEEHSSRKRPALAYTVDKRPLSSGADAVSCLTVVCFCPNPSSPLGSAAAGFLMSKKGIPLRDICRRLRESSRVMAIAPVYHQRRLRHGRQHRHEQSPPITLSASSTMRLRGQTSTRSTPATLEATKTSPASSGRFNSRRSRGPTVPSSSWPHGSSRADEPYDRGRPEFHNASR
jgi:hypothetical protein